jgi:hypothetical protein
MSGERGLSAPDTARGKLQRIALDLLHAKQAAGEIPTSIRFLFYELEQQGAQSKGERINPRTGGAYKRKPAQDLTDAVTALREAGLIPWGWIVDDSRVVHRFGTTPSVAEYVAESVDFARLDPWVDNFRPVIISEAKTVGGVLARGLAREYCVAVAATTGQCRGYLETEVAPLLRDPATRVLYLGDADDAGDDIEANTRGVLERATERGFEFYSPRAGRTVHTWERLMITPDQVADLRVRGVQPILKTDKRYRDGNPHEAFECEALGQRPIVDIVRGRLDELLLEPLEDVLEREAEQRDAVRAALAGLAGMDGTP